MLDSLKSQWTETSLARWHLGLAGRERTQVNLIAALIVAGVAYFGLWQPLSEWSDAQQRRHQQKVILIEWMKAHEAEARQQGRQSGQDQPSGGSLLTLVSSAAKEEGIQLTRFQPEGNGGVSVVLQNQSFDVLMRWLDRLQQQDGVQVRQISVDRQESDGLVNARINLI